MQRQRSKPQPSLVRPYPSPVPTALGKGTYDLTPWGRLARDTGRVAERHTRVVEAFPVARVTVPTGWQAWPGPSRDRARNPSPIRRLRLSPTTYWHSYPASLRRWCPHNLARRTVSLPLARSRTEYRN